MISRMIFLLPQESENICADHMFLAGKSPMLWTPVQMNISLDTASQVICAADSPDLISADSVHNDR